MEGKQLAGDGFSANMAGMSKTQLYEIMCQMKALIEQNHQQARDILIQNPLLTKALFEAQIMLGMVQPPEVIPNIPSAISQHLPQTIQRPQQSNVQAPTIVPGQSGLQDQMSAPQVSNPVKYQQTSQPLMPVSSPSVPSVTGQSQPLISHPSQSVQQPVAHLNAQTTSLPPSSQVHNTPPPIHPALQPPAVQPPIPTTSTQSQQPLHASVIPHMQLQPPMPPQSRPPSMPAYGHQHHSQMGPNAVFQHPGAPQMHQLQPTFHGHPTLPTQPPSQTMYQGGGSHLGMEFSQGGSAQAERGSSWIPGLRDNSTNHLQGPPSYIGQVVPSSQPPRPPPLTPDLETALLQQVMSLTPDQIDRLPPDQRNQVLQLRQMMRR